MIKVIDCSKKKYLSELIKFLDKRRLGNQKNIKIVSKIIKDVKKNKKKALLKYEKKFSKNFEIIPSQKKNK